MALADDALCRTCTQWCPSGSGPNPASVLMWQRVPDAGTGDLELKLTRR